MIYLVDANILSEGTKPAPDQRVVSWLRKHESEIAVDPIILGEIQFGILLLPASARRERLEQWFKEGVAKLHCLEWGLGTSMEWARLLARLRGMGRNMPVKDSLIAASALHHRLTMVTRNERDFTGLGLQVVNPFA